MKKIITYGTFDLFHQGHYNILKRAKEYGDYLIVGVTSESFDLERGKLGVRDSLLTRIENVKKTGFADEIIIEEFNGQKIQDVQKYNIDALVIGSDWIGKFDYLKPYCEVVYLERTKNISSTQIRLQEQFLNVGLILDSDNDGGFVEESKFVSGVHIDRVFCEDLKQANELKQKYQLNEAHDNLEAFMDGLNAVIVNVKTKKAVDYIKKAQKAGKHVLYRFFEEPTLKQIQGLIETAKKKHLLLLDCMVPVYSQAFNQLMWMVECGRIGKVIHADCIVSNTDDSQLNKYYSVLYAVYVASRICASTDFKYTTFKHKFADDKYYLRASLESKGVLIDLEIGEGIDLLPNIKILGEEGQIVVPNDWWNTGYFEIYHNGNPVPERHCYNYEGNGMRYILREALIMLREDNFETTRFSNEYAMALYQACKNITEKVK